MADKLCWRKVRKSEYAGAEEFLRAGEVYCVAACARFLHKSFYDHLWYSPGPEGTLAAMILQSRRSLFPILRGSARIPPPRFLNRLFGNISIHAIQGLREDVSILEEIFRGLGYMTADEIDYDLMTLDGPPESPAAGPPGLIVRPPEPGDREALFPLQAAYEQEEVLPRGVIFDPVSCRLSLDHIINREQSLISCLGGRIVGKINTNAEAFSRFQIGGVYVLPEYRGQGIASRMSASLVRLLAARGKGSTLFVKKRNAAARSVYRKIGFRVLEDYRICYY